MGPNHIDARLGGQCNYGIWGPYPWDQGSGLWDSPSTLGCCIGMPHGIDHQLMGSPINSLGCCIGAWDDASWDWCIGSWDGMMHRLMGYPINSWDG